MPTKFTCPLPSVSPLRSEAPAIVTWTPGIGRPCGSVTVIAMPAREGGAGAGARRTAGAGCTGGAAGAGCGAGAGACANDAVPIKNVKPKQNSVLVRIRPLSLGGFGTGIVQQRQRSESEGGNHHDAPDDMRAHAEPVIEVQPAKTGENRLPVVTLDFGAGAAANQRHLKRARVRDVGGDVDQALSCPPDTHGHAEPVIAPGERHRADDRDDDLEQRPSQYGHELAERRKNDVTRFVKRQLDDVKKGAVHADPVKRMRDELPGPPAE